MQPPSIRPSSGFCIRADSAGCPASRWYLNVCKHRLVELPVAYSGKEVTKEWILTHGLGNLRVPFDVGSFRKLKARADGAKTTCYAIDVIFHPLIVQLYADDEFCKVMDQFRVFVMNMVITRIEDGLGVKLALQTFTLVKSLRYKDGEGEDGATPLELTDLPDLGASEDEPRHTLRPRPVDLEGEPLIQDLTASKKPVLKKGFLNKASSPLYGSEGSKEGVLPENAGDPMGWMPKSLRNKSKIVDCNSPEYQEHEKKKKAVEEANSRNKEFKDILTNDLGKWSNKHQTEMWEEDVPESAQSKYDVDYSRFRHVDDIVEESAPESRDWYLDSNGQRCSVPRRESAAKPIGGLKKGFLSKKERSPLYPTDGSVASAHSEHDLMNDFEVPLQTEMPPHTLEETPQGLVLAVPVPGLLSMSGVSLDVTERHVSLTFPGHESLQPVSVDLPSPVLPTSTKAKFSKKLGRITVTLPTAASAS